jgi:Ca2+-binding RTX toxin-like protein
MTFSGVSEMTSTPTIWKPAFIANTGATAGGQTVPRTIGLTNGNFMVVWEDNLNGPGPFIDIMGRMFNADGVALGTPFQINSAVVASDETGPKIVAMPDGGYVVAYGSYLEAIGGFIGIERFDANGFSVSSRFITDPNSSLTEWDLTVDSAGNYTVVYERLAPHALSNGNVINSQDIFSRTYDNLTNGAGPENAHIAQNSSELDELGAVATFADGRMVTFYSEPDYDFFGNKAQTAEYSIIDPVSGTIIRNPVEIDGPNWDDDAVAIDVACLAYGPFVLLYAFNGNYAFRIGESDAPGSSMSSRNTVATFGALGGARVVALNEGGFFIEWLESTAHILYGQRYLATGAPVGNLLIISTNVSSIGETDMSLTSDGRILVPFKDATGEVSMVILDPRETTIYGTDASEQLTTQTTSSFIYGFGGNDSIYGQNGDDRIDGGTGLDALSGGKGNDVFVLNDSDRSTSYGFDTVVELANGGLDSVEVMSFFRAHRDSPLPTSYTLGANVENGRIMGVETFSLIGNELANMLTGNSASNFLDGKAGADQMSGLQGDDSYMVDNLQDVVFEAVGGGTGDHVFASVSHTLLVGQEVEFLSTSSDTGVAAINLTGNGFAQTITGNAGANRLDGGIDAVSDRLVGLGGNDTYIINSSTDLIDEVAGGGVADRIQSTVSFRLAADDNIEIMTTTNARLTTAINLTGNALAQTIYGNAGANILNGGTDNLRDTMFGYGGNDTYFIGSSADVIVEAVGGGTADRVRSSVSFVLAADDDIESLEAANPAAGTVINLTGNALGQTVVGNAGTNILNGGLGNDTLTGLGGADSFLFNTALNAVSNHDTITDFNSAADTIQLDNAIFQALASGGTLAANLFEATSVAGQSGSEVVIYDRINGDLYYDSNGAATANGLILFAHVTNGTALTNADFFVV